MKAGPIESSAVADTMREAAVISLAGAGWESAVGVVVVLGRCRGLRR